MADPEDPASEGNGEDQRVLEACLGQTGPSCGSGLPIRKTRQEVHKLHDTPAPTPPHKTL